MVATTRAGMVSGTTARCGFTTMKGARRARRCNASTIPGSPERPVLDHGDRRCVDAHPDQDTIEEAGAEPAADRAVMMSRPVICNKSQPSLERRHDRFHPSQESVEGAGTRQEVCSLNPSHTLASHAYAPSSGETGSGPI